MSDAITRKYAITSIASLMQMSATLPFAASFQTFRTFCFAITHYFYYMNIAAEKYDKHVSVDFLTLILFNVLSVSKNQ